jgi:ABC-type branched-subunit amino acid transport system substrate-binding protein
MPPGQPGQILASPSESTETPSTTEEGHNASCNHDGRGPSSAGPIKVGVITDQTGALSFMGVANANVARMVIDDINARGGLLGRQVDLYRSSAPAPCPRNRSSRSSPG